MSRSWCFTINNDTWSDLMMLIGMKFRYMIFGFEIGSENKVPHIQGYVIYDTPKPLSTVKNKLPRAHWESANGSPQQNIAYCTKDGDYYEFGEPPKQGGARWEKIEEAMNDPSSNPHLFNQYKKTYDLVKRADLNTFRKEQDKQLILCDVRKQYEVLKQYNSVYVMHDMLETYLDEEVICMSAYSYTTWLMDWLNGYPPRIKRGYEVIIINPLIVIITFRDMKEYNHVKNIYIDYITDVIHA